MAEFRKVTATASTGFTDLVEITLHVGQFTKVSVSKLPASAGGDALKINAQDFITLAEEEQAKTLSSRTAPDFSLQVEDGKGGTFEFSGFVLGAGASISEGAVSCQVSAIHRAALMASYRPDIYQIFDATRPDESPSLVTGPSVMGRLLDIIKLRKEAWADPVERCNTGIAAVDSIYDQVDTSNAISGPVAEELLEASRETTKYDVIDSLSAYEGANSALNDSLGNYLDTRSGNFFSTLENMATEFRLIYVPDLGDTVGKFQKISEIFGSRTEKDCATVGMDVNITSSSVLPVGKVFIHGLMAAGVRAETEGSEVAPGFVADVIAEFPAGEASGGTFEILPAPTFMQAPLTGDGVGNGDSSDFTKLQEEQAQTTKELMEFTAATAEAFGLEFAKQSYLDMALAGSQVSLTAELDLTWQPGVYYSVNARSKIDGATLLFWGLLQSVVHTIRSTAKGPVAQSSLTFSHTLLGDLLIPGMEV